MDVADLKALINSQAIKPNGLIDRNLQMVRVCADSRQVRPGDIFVAVRGPSLDGHEYIAQAIAAGARIVVAEREVSVPQGVTLVKAADTTGLAGELAQLRQGNPAEKMSVLGVTGTKGKTTVAYLTRAILAAGGYRCGMIGTIEYDLGLEKRPADNTTPGAMQLAEMMGAMAAAGLPALVMECSSHGLDQGRTSGIRFRAAAFTNLTGDHLDYHKDQESYFRAKSLLFSGLNRGATAVVNADDPAGARLTKLTAATVWQYGLERRCEISAAVHDLDLRGGEFTLSLLGRSLRVRTPLAGRHNISNCLAAAGLAHAAGMSLDTIARGIETFGGVPGRLERVDAGREFTVLVDYAHTDDSLRATLATIRDLRPRRIIVVFGCGGDRDRTKRPRMAAVTEKLADRIIVTNDNPRTEDPAAIIAEIRAGFSPAGRERVIEEPDRRAAIERAISEAAGGDVVLIAGKGHEDYQIIGKEKVHFDDRETAREILSRNQPRRKSTITLNHEDTKTRRKSKIKN